MLEQVRQAVADAQLVLVGIGKEFEESFEGMKEDAFYAPLLEQLERLRQEEAVGRPGSLLMESGEEYAARIMQYLKFHYLKRHPNERLIGAYDRLAALLEGKNCFIVTLCTDDLIFSSRLPAERIVAPCGGYRAMQCRKECTAEQEALVTDENVMRALLESIDGCCSEIDEIDFPVCAECVRPLWFNQIGSPDYKEEGYLPQWQLYTKWLQGTLNKELCILELGAGMEFPQIIRFPFEKVGFFNQKARFFRVHSRLYQLTEELKGKGEAVCQDPVEFLNET